MAAVEALLPGDVVEREVVIWAPSSKRVVGKKQTRLGALVLREETLPPDRLTDERCAPVIVAALQKEVLLLIGGSGGGGAGNDNNNNNSNEGGFEAALGLPSSFASWRARCVWLRAAEMRASGGASDLPDLSARALVRSMPRWLSPLLAGCRSRADVSKSTDLLASALKALLSPDQQRRVERDAPSRAPLPLGGTAAIDYSHPAGPTARARVQEVFGLAETPLLGGPSARIPLRLELLDPAQRPLAATSDLASFWKVGWPLARKDMRGRYPKHVWPEDGATAEPTRMTKAKTEAAAARAKAEVEGVASGAAAGGGKKKGGGGGKKKR
jgi:ATP-dependent helicase HrpB